MDKNPSTLWKDLFLCICHFFFLGKTPTLLSGFSNDTKIGPFPLHLHSLSFSWFMNREAPWLLLPVLPWDQPTDLPPTETWRESQAEFQSCSNWNLSLKSKWDLPFPASSHPRTNLVMLGRTRLRLVASRMRVILLFPFWCVSTDLVFSRNILFWGEFQRSLTSAMGCVFHVVFLSLAKPHRVPKHAFCGTFLSRPSTSPATPTWRLPLQMKMGRSAREACS